VRSISSNARASKTGATFFTLWTLKEAYLKAVGEGLSRQFHQFEIWLVPGKAPNLEISARGNSISSCWNLLSFVPEEGFRAALAVEGNSLDIEFLVPTSDLFSI
jgi:4'-phosphopantetheinyl transferase